jgi:hypothetical protein
MAAESRAWHLRVQLGRRPTAPLDNRVRLGLGRSGREKHLVQISLLGQAQRCQCYNCYVAVTASTSVSARMRRGFERRGMSAFKGVVASTDHFDSTFQAAADTNGIAIAIRRASVH